MTMPTRHTRHIAPRLMLSVLSLVVALSASMAFAPHLMAASTAQSTPVLATRVSGNLPHQYSAHYLGLQTAQRDGTMVLTLSYDPQDPQIAGKINFLVMTEDGLRRFLAGEDPAKLGIAMGSSLRFGTAGIDRLQAAIKDSGRGNYTVVVYNESTAVVNYELVVQNGVLQDTNGQVLANPADIVAPTPTPTPPAQPATATVVGRRLSGDLDGTFDRHYLSVEPAVVDGVVNLSMIYDPIMRPELQGAVNFWVLDEDGVRRLVQGANPADLDLASGNPLAVDPQPNKVDATFKASGKNDYTAVIYNVTGMTATYAISADGGLLVDRYGQTNESIAAAAEEAALSATATPTPEALPLPDNAGIDVSPQELPGQNSATVSVKRQGELLRQYDKHFLGVYPTIRNGRVTLLMDYAPRDNEELSKNINFYVLDADGLRRVVAGSRPEDLDIASGTVVAVGPAKGKLSAEFVASGRGGYTIVVFNNSAVPATYTLEASGGVIEDTMSQTVAVNP